MKVLITRNAMRLEDAIPQLMAELRNSGGEMVSIAVAPDFEAKLETGGRWYRWCRPLAAPRRIELPPGKTRYVRIRANGLWQTADEGAVSALTSKPGDRATRARGAESVTSDIEFFRDFFLTVAVLRGLISSMRRT